MKRTANRSSLQLLKCFAGYTSVVIIRPAVTITSANQQIVSSGSATVYTFGFLISDPESLARCSEAHPVFSRMVEKYQYYHIIICIEKTRGKLLEPSHFTKLLSDKPRITTYVRVLQVKLYYHGLRSRTPYLEQIAAILPMLPVLECLLLSTPHTKVSWQDFPEIFRKAVEGCLRLPTLQEVHVCCSDFPLSTLDNHANIDCFSFSGTPQLSEFGDATYPHLRTLSVENFHCQRGDQMIFSAWAIQHIVKLQLFVQRYISTVKTPTKAAYHFFLLQWKFSKTASSLQQVTIEINVDFSTGYVDCDDFVTNCDLDYSPLTALAQSFTISIFILILESGMIPPIRKLFLCSQSMEASRI